MPSPHRVALSSFDRILCCCGLRCLCSALPGCGLLWFALPLLGFAWLWFLPPHSLDIAISKVFFSDGVWWGRTQWWVEPLLHQAPKYLSILIAICAAGKLSRLWAKTSSSRVAREEARPEMQRLMYLLVSMLACVLVIYFLKTSTGVSCPAKTVEFGGVNEIKSAALAFVLAAFPATVGRAGRPEAVFACSVFISISEISPSRLRAWLSVSFFCRERLRDSAA